MADRYVWMKVTNDKYELPVAIADSSEELAKMVGVKTGNNIRRTMCMYKKLGKRPLYVKVLIDDDCEDT